MILPGGNTWTYGYQAAVGHVLPKDDPNNLSRMLSRITDDQNRPVDCVLDQMGRIHEAISNQVYKGTTLTACQYTRYYYDYGTTKPWLRELKILWKYKVNGVWQSRALYQNDYTYDNSGLRLTNLITDQNGPVRTETYGYDELNRLTSVNYGDGGVPTTTPTTRTATR